MKARFEEFRDVTWRYVIQGELQLSSPTHLGGSDPDATSDRPLVRDGQGRPYLPGTTLTGLLRRVRPDSGLFGDKPEQAESDTGSQARFFVSDSPVVEEGPVATELRDGVKIDGMTGTAEDKKKFDTELLPAGTRFRMRFQLDLPSTPDEAGTNRTDCVRLLSALEAEFPIGARTRRGWGGATAVPVSGRADKSRWVVDAFDLTKPAGMLAWVGRDLADLPRTWPRCVAEGFDQPTWTAGLPSANDLADRWGVQRLEPHVDRGMVIRLSLALRGSLIVRSPGPDTGHADASHLGVWDRTAPAGSGAPLPGPGPFPLPGTSLAGVLRHRCLRIAKTLASADRQNEAVRLVDVLFGTTGSVSRVRVAEAGIDGATVLRHTRVRIDPWTGGAAESLLFSADALFGGRVEPTIGLSEKDPNGDPNEKAVSAAGRALLLLAVRDLAAGHLAVGGEGSIGRGLLGPRDDDGAFASVTHAGESIHLFLAKDGSVRCEPNGEAFKEDFEHLHEHLGGRA